MFVCDRGPPRPPLDPLGNRAAVSSKLRMNPALIFSRVRFIFDRRNRDGPYVPRRPSARPKTADEPGAHIFVLPFDIDHRFRASRHVEPDHGRNCGTNPALGFESIRFIASIERGRFATRGPGLRCRWLTLGARCRVLDCSLRISPHITLLCSFFGQRLLTLGGGSPSRGTSPGDAGGALDPSAGTSLEFPV